MQFKSSNPPFNKLRSREISSVVEQSFYTRMVRCSTHLFLNTPFLRSEIDVKDLNSGKYNINRMRIDAMVAYLTHDQLIKVRFLNPLDIPYKVLHSCLLLFVLRKPLSLTLAISQVWLGLRKGGGLTLRLMIDKGYSLIGKASCS